MTSAGTSVGRPVLTLATAAPTERALVLGSDAEERRRPVDGVHDGLEQTSPLELVGGNFPGNFGEREREVERSGNSVK